MYDRRVRPAPWLGWLVGGLVASCGSPSPAPPAAPEAAPVAHAEEDASADWANVQLTDGQLTGPMRGVLAGCRVPSNAKVTIKTAVQNGRAIGVTIGVAFEHPKTMKHITSTTARYETKLSAKIVTCADKAVRNVTWPPSKRRDSFTTTF